LVIEKTKQVKDELESSIDAKTFELNNLKNLLNKTKKTNLSVAVDNQNMEMIQNVKTYYFLLVLFIFLGNFPGKQFIRKANK